MTSRKRRCWAGRPDAEFKTAICRPKRAPRRSNRARPPGADAIDVAHLEPGGRAADRAVLPPHVAALPASQRATDGRRPRSTSSLDPRRRRHRLQRGDCSRGRFRQGDCTGAKRGSVEGMLICPLGHCWRCELSRERCPVHARTRWEGRHLVGRSTEGAGDRNHAVGGRAGATRERGTREYAAGAGCRGNGRGPGARGRPVRGRVFET